MRRFNLIGDRLEVTGATMGGVPDILNGFRLYRVVGGPGWMRTDRFDIVAKADRPVDDSDVKSAMMGLLADRFQLQSRTETRDTPGSTIRASKTPGALKRAPNGEKFSLRMTDGDVAFNAVSMDALTNYLSQVWAAPWKTRRSWKETTTSRWQRPEQERHPGDKWGDWVREALEEMGSRVEGRTIAMDVTVVDRCERPNEN